MLAYNVFAFDTTIEGALINKQSFDFTMVFLKQKCKIKETDFDSFNEILKKYSSKNQLNALRYVFKGKSDLLQYKKIKISDIDDKNVFNNMQGYVQKGSGWVSIFLDTFFEEQTEKPDNFSISVFQNYLKDEENKLKIEKSFGIYFSEIYSLINQIYDIIK